MLCRNGRSKIHVLFCQTLHTTIFFQRVELETDTHRRRHFYIPHLHMWPVIWECIKISLNCSNCEIIAYFSNMGKHPVDSEVPIHI